MSKVRFITRADDIGSSHSANLAAAKVAKGRANETKLFSGFLLKSLMGSTGCSGIRYDEAEFDKRITIDEVREVLSKANSNDK